MYIGEMLKELTSGSEELAPARELLKSYLEFVDAAGYAAGGFYERAAWTAAEKWTESPTACSFSEEAAAAYGELWKEEVPRVLERIWAEKMMKSGAMPQDLKEAVRACVEPETVENYQYSCMEDMLTPWAPAADCSETSERKKLLEAEKNVIRMWMFPDREELHSAVWFEMTQRKLVEDLFRTLLRSQ